MPLAKTDLELGDACLLSAKTDLELCDASLPEGPLGSSLQQALRDSLPGFLARAPPRPQVLLKLYTGRIQVLLKLFMERVQVLLNIQWGSAQAVQSRKKVL